MNLHLNKLGGVKNAVTSRVGLKVLATQKHSPAILFGAGVVGLVGTVVLASRASLQLNEVLDEFEDKKALSEEVRKEHPEKYTEQMKKSDAVVLRTHLILDVCKLYAPAVILGSATIAAFGGSHYILTKRNAGLTAALVALDKSMKEYRARVVGELGEDKDREFMYGVATRDEYSEKKNGEPKVTQVKTFDKGRSPYAVVFDQENTNWQKTMEYNLFFLRLTQNHLNDRLRARGNVFLNDVYRELGLPDTEEGSVVGWLWGPEAADGFIDFGIWSDQNMESVHEFLRGQNGEFLLDFNVDGPIHKKLKKNRKG